MQTFIVLCIICSEESEGPENLKSHMPFLQDEAGTQGWGMEVGGGLPVLQGRRGRKDTHPRWTLDRLVGRVR